ncbi:MAG: transcriptional regulator NrdR [archaeon]
MICPFCQKSETKVTDKRDANGMTRRRRECNGCEKRFTTYERVELLNLFVVKKNGAKEIFDSEKIRKGMFRACEKRGISDEKIGETISLIESKLRNYKSNEVPSAVVGELVMKHLMRLDKVAYIRFASVYREFADITSFQDEVKQLLKK